MHVVACLGGQQAVCVRRSSGRDIISYGVPTDPLVQTLVVGASQQIRDFTKWDISAENQSGKFSISYTTSQRGKITVEWEKGWKTIFLCSPVSSPQTCSSLPSTICTNVSLVAIVQKHFEAFSQDIPASTTNLDKQPQLTSPLQTQEPIPFGKQTWA